MKIAWVLALLIAGTACADPAKIVLTFDDGPVQKTTSLILDELAKRDAKAAFFVLTTPETLFRNMPWRLVFTKAETPEGLQTLIDEASQGHMLACHWGGAYIAQSKYHPNRLAKPAYDATGDGEIDRISQPGNALESDLIECQQRVNQALGLAQDSLSTQTIQLPGNIDYIRPPIWKYANRRGDARQVYASLGMQMVLTDFKLGDGGYRFLGFPSSRKMARQTAKAILNGQDVVVLTLHDSNSRTAKNIGRTLTILESTLQENGLVRGEDWDYTRSLNDIDQALQTFLQRQNEEIGGVSK